MSGSGRIVIAGRYELLEVAGSGGMAAVWRGVMREGDHQVPVAIKRILSHIARDPAIVALFHEEARVGRQLAHPNIVQVLDDGKDDAGNDYLVMEWVEGLDLYDYMRSYHAARVHVPWQAVAAIGFQILRGLAAAHERVDGQGQRRPVIHRDLTPSNILLGVDGVVKVADFGLARATDRATMTFPNIIKGKVSYTAPELLYGHKANEQSDVYSLGVTLWEALAARKLYSGKNYSEVLAAIQFGEVPSLSKLRPDCPAELIRIVLQALERDVQKRWKTARQMAEPLLAFVRSIRPSVDARRLGGSVQQARDRLRAIDGKLPVIMQEASSDSSIEISIEVSVDEETRSMPAREFRAELSDPFAAVDED
ncbi:MAG TPA: serine/threonine-protein kinase [Polyangiaceae bacterium]|nr:MAG: Tyrosine-protein kinase MasK [Deltaproteobacteria bacterium ADurb.Bin207]HNZ22303.1 serine/threonine-protein kinase [Polyangiaceae bacterium]HOD20837.1 serine/threonine-protein kinase [Polyangiaceae bacterium]HOE51232.1 serine/threonine-protein kinase [Polyangiaceae bacterium]HOG99972.1 serine/threonine-protein kinase [Polyangiaceae bacterium]